jgi:hypothetical protein
MKMNNDKQYDDLYRVYEKLNDIGKRKLIRVAERLLDMNHILVDKNIILSENIDLDDNNKEFEN